MSSAPNGGNGGFAEVSGKQNLEFTGTADLTAPQGELGELLLDPLDLVVATTSTVSPESGQRGQALHLIRNPVFAAVQRRVAGEPR